MQNPYFGKRSVAKAPMKGKMDEDYEFVLGCYAVGHDSMDSVLLGNKPNEVTKANLSEISSRFHYLKSVCARRAPRVVPLINHLEKITVAHNLGQLSTTAFKRELRKVANQENIPNRLLDKVENRINDAQVRAVNDLKKLDHVPPHRVKGFDPRNPFAVRGWKR